MSAAIFDLAGGDSCVSGDDMAIRKPHDESRIVGASIGIDEEPRKPRQKCGSTENTGEMACDPSRANIVGDVTVELFLRQTERAIGLWQRICRMITKEEDARLETSSIRSTGSSAAPGGGEIGTAGSTIGFLMIQKVARITIPSQAQNDL